MKGGLDENMTDLGPWHEGERDIHRRLGLTEAIDPVGRRNIRRFMPDQHRLFFAQLPFAFLGALDRTGRPWVTVLGGRPGFLASPDPKLLCVAAYPPDGDPAAEGILVGARIALLGIELPTRRRNRMNGVVIDLDVGSFMVVVEQSFGNCPQYIQISSAAITAQFGHPASRSPNRSASKTNGHLRCYGGQTPRSLPPRPRP
jgi:uncharacterized protein